MMGRRFYFSGTSYEAWQGPFDTRGIPRIDEMVSIRCKDRIIWWYDLNEIHILLKYTS